MLSVEERPEAAEEKTQSNGEEEIRSPKSPVRSEGSGSPTSLIFSWRRMKAEEKEKGEYDDDDDEDLTSPPLWKPGFVSKPYYPMSLRAQEIARGRQELMKLYDGMPESAYELSLKDLVDQKSATEKLQQEQGSSNNDPDETQNPNKGLNVKSNSHKKKKASSNVRKKNSYPTSFLLNIFVPSSFTTRPGAPSSRPLSPKRPHLVRKNSDQSSKSSSNPVVKEMPRKYNLWSLFRIRPSKGSDVSHSNSFSKVSPRPYSGKDCHSGVAVVDKSMDPNLNNNYSRCFMCSGHAVYFKTNCQVMFLFNFHYIACI